MQQIKNGLMVNIFKNSDNYSVDCTNNGISSNHTKSIIYGKKVQNGNIDYDDPKVAKLYIHSRIINGVEHLRATPNPDPDQHYMFGGNFIYTSDSRFPSDQPIKIHDRIEDERLSVKQIFEISDELHELWDNLHNGDDIEQDYANMISHELCNFAREYQDVLNFEQRGRLSRGLKN